MRKFISIIFISVFCSNAVLAAITCTPTATTECEVGCFVSSISETCVSCEFGFYTDTKGQSECRQCNKPLYAKFKSAGTSSDGCLWEMTCKAGTHYVSNTTQSGCQPCSGNTFTADTTFGGTGYGSTIDCFQCGFNSTATSDHTNCNCNPGYHIMGQDETSTKNNSYEPCEPNIYTITYKSNNGQNQTKTQDTEYNSTITLFDEDTFTHTGYEFSGWKYQNVYNPGDQLKYTFTSDITLTAQWTAKEFTVTYNVNGATNCALSNQECTYGKSGCTAPDLKNCTKTGHTFGGWNCTGCNSGVGTITIGKDISTLSNGNDMVLTANWVKCSAGKYCTNVATELPCPAGSTSAAGSSAITHCYMTGGTTTICDINNKCFTLPGTNKIYYHDGK